MRQVEQRPRGAVSVWTLVQVLSILVWIAGFVIAFYYLTYKGKPLNLFGTTLKLDSRQGQVAGMIVTGVAYLAIVFSMIKHSPDRGR